MKLRRTTKEALALSVTVHVVAIIAFALLSLVSFLRAKEKPVILELVDVGAIATESPPTNQSERPKPPPQTPTEPTPDFQLPRFDDLKPTPEVTLPDPPPRAEPPPSPSPTPAPTANPPPKPPPRQISYDQFRDRNPASPPPRTVVNQPRRNPVTAPVLDRVDVSQLRSHIAADSFDFSSVAPGQRDALQTYFATLQQRLSAAFAPTARLVARVEFRLEVDGRLTNVRIIKTSGDASFDQAAVQACYRVRGPGTPPGNPPYTRTVTFTGEN